MCKNRHICYISVHAYRCLDTAAEQEVKVELAGETEPVHLLISGLVMLQLPDYLCIMH